jgi:hypothetical protein
MNTIRTIIVAAALSALSGYAQAAETLKPLQGVSFQTEMKDAVAYYLADKGTCKVVVMTTDKTFYAPARFEQAVKSGKPSLLRLDNAKSLEFACAPEAKALSINVLNSIAQH